MKQLVIISFLIAQVYTMYADGILDASFGEGFGYITLPSGFYARGLAILQDGKIVIAGSDESNTFNVVRYNSDGSLDTTFNGTGIGVSGGTGMPFSVVAYPDGSLILAGEDLSTSFKLVKYKADGTLDITFGVAGIVIGPVGLGVDSVLQLDGKIIVGGSNNLGGSLLVRYNTLGVVDTLFSLGPSGFIESVKVQRDGKVVVAGTNGSGNIQVVRYNAIGTLDITFGTLGIVTGPAGVATGLVIQPDGRLVVGGYNLNASPNMLLIRYNTNGSLDGTFGTAGVVTGPADFKAHGITLQSDGYIVVAGTGNSGIKLTRYNATGNLDTSFGIGGTVSDPLGDIFNVGLQTNGYIVTVGNDIAANNYQVARYTSSPALADTSITSSSTQAAGVVSLAGGAQNPSQIFVYLNGQAIGTTNTDAGGTNTWTFSTTISVEGLYALRVVSLYKDGNNLASTGDALRIY